MTLTLKRKAKSVLDHASAFWVSHLPSQKWIPGGDKQWAKTGLLGSPEEREGEDKRKKGNAASPKAAEPSLK